MQVELQRVGRGLGFTEVVELGTELAVGIHYFNKGQAGVSCIGHSGNVKVPSAGLSRQMIWHKESGTVRVTAPGIP